MPRTDSGENATMGQTATIPESPARPLGQMPSTASSTATPATTAPLTPDHQTAILQARRDAKPIRRAANLAAFSGWSTSVIAGFAFLSVVLTLLLSQSIDGRGLLISIVLTACGVFEIACGRSLRRFDLRMPRRLAVNQIVLMVGVVIYAAMGLHAALYGPGQYDTYLESGGDIADAIRPIDSLTRNVMAAVMISLIVGTVFMQGGAAIYYATRRPVIERFRATTPEWIRNLLSV